MTTTTSLSGARAATVAGLLAGAVGILVLRVSGVAMPVVPPGLVLLVVAAGLVGLTRWRWAPAAGALVGLAEVAGFVGSGSYAGLLAVDDIGILLGAWIRGVGVGVAVVAGIAATVEARRRTVIH